MSPTPKSRRLLAAAGLALGSLVLVSGSALAGSCPVDKVGVDVTKPGAMKPKDVTDDVLAAIDLSKEKIALAGRQLRLRKLVVQPGGIVPWHSHDDRPALIYVVSGRSPNMPATARCRSSTRPARSRAESAAPRRIGGRTTARSRRCCSPPTSSTSTDDQHVM